MPSRDKLIAVSKHSANKTFLEEVGISPEFAFREDKRRDDTAFKQGKLPSQKVAYYKMKLFETLDGFKFYDPGRKKKSRKNVDPRFFQKSYMRRFLGQEGVTNMTRPPSKLNLPPPCLGMDFISISLKSKDEDSASSLHIYDMTTAMYLEGKGGLQEMENEAEEESAASFKLHLVQEKTREYNERLRENPSDIQLWLEYVEFQDVSIGESEFGGKINEAKKEKVGKNVVLRQKALVEKKLAILKAAIDKNPMSVELGVKRLEVSRELLEAKLLDRQWKELIFLFPRSFSVWKFYLRFVSSNFTTFTVARALREYKNYFAKLKQMHALPDQPKGTEDEIIVATVNLCNFLARAGFREKGTAIWQASLELNLFAPDFPGYYSLDDKLATFEQFWESAVPRFGEPGALGFANVMRRRKEVVGDDDNDGLEDNKSAWEDDLIDQAGNLVRRNRLWLELELGRERRHWCPFRSTEEAPEDPDRSVSFEDISPFLFHFTQPSKVLSLLVGFARYLGVTFRDEPYSTTSLCSETITAKMGVSTSEGLQDGVDWSPDIDIKVLRDIRPDLEDKDYQTFCRNIFSQSVAALQGQFKTQMIALWLRFEYDLFLLEDIEDAKKKKARKKEMKRLVKTLLEEDRDNVDIYVEYARLEQSFEGAKAAWKILETLMSSKSSSEHPTLYMAAVAVCLREIEGGGDDVGPWTDRAIWLLCVFGREGTHDPSKMPKSKVDLLSWAEETKSQVLGEVHARMTAGRFIARHEEDELNTSPVYFRSSYFCKAFVAAWLTLFLDGEREAVKIVGLVEPPKVSKNKAVVLLRENLCKVSLDLVRCSASASHRRAVLKGSLYAFPSNEYFLQKLLDYRVQCNVVDPTWRAFSAQLVERSATASSPLPQIYAVKLLVSGFVRHRRDEESLPVALSFLNRARSMLERFVSSGDAGRHCPALWRLLMWTCNWTAALRSGDAGGEAEGKAAVNTVFYRSLQDCPAVKSLFLDVVGYLHLDPAPDAAEDGLRRVLDITAEKEARVRMPIEELEVLLEKEEDDDDGEEEFQ